MKRRQSEMGGQKEVVSATAKWLIGILVSLLLVLGGMVAGQRSVSAQVAEHANQEGHPVMVERVVAVLAALARIERLQEAQDRKIDELLRRTP